MTQMELVISSRPSEEAIVIVDEVEFNEGIGLYCVLYS